MKCCISYSAEVQKEFQVTTELFAGELLAKVGHMLVWDVMGFQRKTLKPGKNPDSFVHFRNFPDFPYGPANAAQLEILTNCAAARI